MCQYEGWLDRSKADQWACFTGILFNRNKSILPWHFIIQEYNISKCSQTYGFLIDRLCGVGLLICFALKSSAYEGKRSPPLKITCFYKIRFGAEEILWKISVTLDFGPIPLTFSPKDVSTKCFTLKLSSYAALGKSKH